MKLRSALKLAAVPAAAALALAAMPGAAQADDNGDGSTACNYTEICFQWVYNSNNLVKQFWNGANHYSNGAHGAYYFFDVPNGVRSSARVMDNAEGFRNRDSACTVWLWDVDGAGNWYTYYSQGKNSGSFTNSGANRNNGHSRCSGTASPANL
ncbi:hypothetical protein [Paractinoplanes globisporus]|uniref:Peptidase inhibitor family I36 n=1 Tax=Paractinoplanes globisporus TaxID=113565 RepID=A0ABW6WA05_9ACTN|nr:hypothetical protein [Actinoplanes globisporus]